MTLLVLVSYIWLEVLPVSVVRSSLGLAMARIRIREIDVTSPRRKNLKN